MAAENIKSPVTFHMVTPGGPALAYHVGCIVREKFYVHGGINKSRSTSPLNALYCFDFNVGTWEKIQAPDSPSLSHHACVVMDDRYIVMIGGWNGKIRTGDIFAFDVTNNQWIHPTTTGFPSGAGLSSHTAVLLDNGKILVLGCEGSLRMQKRYSSTFILNGSVRNGFHYSEPALFMTSRSGHTVGLSNSKAVIIGGRDDNVLEFLPVENRTSSQSSSKFTFTESVSSSLAVLPKGMAARRHHIAVCCGDGNFFVHGGLTFDGRNRDPVPDMFLLSMKPRVRWLSLGKSNLGLAGHVCCASNDRVVIHGGEGSKGIIHCSTFELQTVT